MRSSRVLWCLDALYRCELTLYSILACTFAYMLQGAAQSIEEAIESLAEGVCFEIRRTFGLHRDAGL